MRGDTMVARAACCIARNAPGSLQERARQAKPADGFALHVIEGGQRLRWTGTASPSIGGLRGWRAANQK